MDTNFTTEEREFIAAIEQLDDAVVKPLAKKCCEWSDKIFKFDFSIPPKTAAAKEKRSVKRQGFIDARDAFVTDWIATNLPDFVDAGIYPFSKDLHYYILVYPLDKNTIVTKPKSETEPA